MVEPRFIYAHHWVCMSWPKIFCRCIRACIESEEDLLEVRKSFNAVSWIVLRFQLIVKGRAKILLGVEFFLPNHMSLDVCMCKIMSVICSRKGVCSCVDML